MDKMTTSYVFQTDSIEVKKAFQNPNYLIEYKYTGLKEKNCVLYFSSNNIYHPNSKDSFRSSIIDKDKYEWYNTRIENGVKHIFLRDIQKQWYLKGINSKLNSIEKVLKFLKKETLGYSVITIGSSAGGYAAVLFGSLLNAEKILTFNGQFHVSDLLTSSNEAVDPVIFREQFNPYVNKYFSLKNFLNNPSNIYYFFSNKSKWDQINKNHILEEGINIISFNTNNHGIPFVKSALLRVINSSKQELNSWMKNSHFPIFFSIKYGGIYATLRVLIKKII